MKTSSPTQRNLRDTEGEMQEMDNRDRELLNALQGEIPLVSTPYAFLGQTLDMSEKEVIKRTERLRRDGVVRQLAAHFDARGLGYRSCLVAARVSPSRIDEGAAAIGAHPGVTQNYRRNNEFNLWFTLFVSPQSKLGLEKTIDILGRQAECDVVRALPTLKLYKSAGQDGESHADGAHGEYTPLTPQEIECVRLLQKDLPLQPRPFDVLARNSGIGADELLAAARTLQKRGQMRRLAAVVASRKSGFVASAMGVWVVSPTDADDLAAKLSQHRAVSHCYLRPVYDDWPYNLYTTVHARSVDECESVINDLATDTGITQKQALFPMKEYKKVRATFFSQDEDEWEDAHGRERAVAAG
jgi:DNA-binding Lrp family transcriptional regulator